MDFFFFSSRRRHTRLQGDWSSDVCSSDLSFQIVTALACLIAVTIWKEAGFFMIFYLAALQSIAPVLGEAASLEGAGRWYFFRRVTFPLLMPTTLFVLVNAVINSFRLVDHIDRKSVV